MSGYVEVRSSVINGLGVFAQKAFRAGSIVLEIDDSRIVDELRPLKPNEDSRHCDYLQDCKVILMQIPERHINHSCDPNTYTKTIDGKRLVFALRDINIGEEITYDYCINSSGDIVWECHCNASRCRHTIHSDFFHLPIEIQLEYLPLLDGWFCEERRSDVEQLERNLPHHLPP